MVFKALRVNHVVIDDDRASIVLKGDEHYGSGVFDGDLNRKSLDRFLKKGFYVIGMGDNLETATKSSVGAGVFEQDDIVQGQLESYISDHMGFAESGKLLGLHIGNHEARVFEQSGTNLSKIMAQMLDVPYLGAGVVHYIQVGKQNYVFYTAHGGSGSIKPHTKIKACIDLQHMVDADLYGMGHTHQLSHHVRQFYSLNKRNKTLVESEKHFVLSGAYLNHWGSYGQTKGYEMMRKGSPVIQLSGLEKKIRVTLE